MVDADPQGVNKARGLTLKKSNDADTTQVLGGKEMD